MQNLDQWLRRLGLDACIPVFVEHAIDWDVLPDLTDSDLEQLGLRLGQRKRLLKALAALETGEQLREAPAYTRRIPASAVPPAAQAEHAPQRRHLTVLFADMVGSTELSQRLDPEDLRDLMHTYQSACRRAIERYEGYLARYVGDGVLAYFGYPEAHEDDPERAVRSGLALVESMKQLAADRGDNGEVKIEVRVGISTGEVLAGDLVGQGSSRQNTVIGQTPNLTVRLTALADANSVVIGPSTHKLLGRLFTYEDLGPRHLKGFPGPLNCWRVLQERSLGSRFEAAHAQLLTAIVGREEELELLSRRWQRARDGAGQAVLISGEPGIGKSRLVEEFRKRLETEPHASLRYQCSPYHTNSALYPIIDHLQRSAQLQASDSPAQKLRKLEALLENENDESRANLEPLANLLSIQIDDHDALSGLTAQQQKDRILDALLSRIEQLAARRPLFLVFEDIHWIDPTSSELLELILGHADRQKVMALVTFRPGRDAPCTSEPHVTTIWLRKLSKEQSESLVRDITREVEMPCEINDEIVKKSGGVPLFVEELTKAILESGVLTERDGRYWFEGAPPSLAIPVTLQDSLMARLDRLGSAKDIAQIGAVIGPEFSHDLLSAIANLPEGELDEALATLTKAGQLLRRGTPPNATYSFRHGLMRDAAYDNLLKSRRQQLHGEIADVIETRFPERLEGQPESLARHYSEAGTFTKSIPCWHRAGLQALKRSAIREAASHLKRGLSELEARPAESDENARQELALRTALGAALISARGWGDISVGNNYTRAHALCRQLGDESNLFPILYGLRSFHVVRGELGRAHELAQELMLLAKDSEDAAKQCKAHLAMGMTSFYYGNFAQAKEHFELSHALYRSQPRTEQDLVYGTNTGPAVLSRSALNLWHLGYPDTALSMSEENIASAQARLHAFNFTFAQHDSAMLEQLAHNPPKVAELAEAAIARSSEYGFSNLLAGARMLLGWASVVETGKGLEQIQQGLRDYRATGSEIWRPYFLSLLADAYRLLAEHELGLATVNDALGITSTTGERWSQAALLHLQGRLWLERDEPDVDKATGCFVQSLSTAARQNAKSLELRASLSLAGLYRAQGRSEAALALLSPLHEWFKGRGDTTDLRQLAAMLRELDRSEELSR